MCFVYAVTWKETERAAGRQSQNVLKPRDNKAIFVTLRIELVKVTI